MSSGKAYPSASAAARVLRECLYLAGASVAPPAAEGGKMAGKGRATVPVGALSDLADKLRAGEALHVERQGRQRVARGPVELGEELEAAARLLAVGAHSTDTRP